MGNPDTLIAAVKDDGPGMGITFIESFRAFFTSKYPGSEIRGVPASVISAISFPDLSLEMK